MKKNLLSVLAIIAFFTQTAFAEQRLYWSSPHDGNEGIFSAKLDGTDIRRVLDLRDPNTILGLFRRPGAIAIDDINERLYFADTTNNDILSVNLQGADPQLIYDEGAPQISDLDFDSLAQTIYYTTDTGFVGKKPLAGSHVQSFPSGFNGVAVAPLSQPNGHLYIGAANGVRYYELTNFAGGIFFLTSTPYAVGKIEYMHTANQLAFYNPVEDQVMVRQLGSPSDIPLLQFPDSLYIPQFMAFNRNESLLFWTNSANDKIYLAPLGNFNVMNPPIEFASASSPLGIAVSCGKFAPDPDNDGTPSCDEACPNDNSKIAPGICGCGVSDADSDGDGTADCNDQCPGNPSKIIAGICGCGIPEGGCPTPTPTPGPTTTPIMTPGSTVTPSAPDEPAIRQLAPGLKITTPPLTVVNGKNVTLIFEKFLKATLKKPGKGKRSADLLAAKKSKVTSRYIINIKNTSTRTKDIRILSIKKNEITLKNLKPGNYSVNYRAEILKDGQVAAKTNLSPSATFTIS